MLEQELHITDEHQGKTLAAALRRLLPKLSWSKARKLVESRRITIDDSLCLDSARRLRTGEKITVAPRAAAKATAEETIAIRHLDEHLVVVEKPAGIATVRHPAERDWSRRRKAQTPVLDELVQAIIAKREHRQIAHVPRLRIVQRLDKMTSGLIVFARSVLAERGLGKQFHRHSVNRSYLAIVPGRPAEGRIESNLVRDRGDGRRGSTDNKNLGKRAITYVDVVETFGRYALVKCRLETGRTHQIRIHLAEAGHPICGDPVYHRLADGGQLGDVSGAPRLALHAAEIGFVHPATEQALHWSAPLPADLRAFVDKLRQQRA